MKTGADSGRARPASQQVSKSRADCTVGEPHFQTPFSALPAEPPPGARWAASWHPWRRRGTSSIRVLAGHPETKMASHFRTRVGGHPASSDSFHRRVGVRVCFRAGFLALGSSLTLSLPMSFARHSGRLGGLGESSSPITVAGPRPICTAFPFVSDPASEPPRKRTFQRTDRGLESTGKCSGGQRGDSSR